MLQVQHFVVEDVLHRREGNSGMIEDAADDDGIVRRIVMAQTVTGAIAAPCQLWTGHKSVEESRVQIFKNKFQVVGASLRGIDPLAPAYLPQQMGFIDDTSA